MGCWLAPIEAIVGGVCESRLYQTSFAGCLLSVLHGTSSFCWDEVVTMMRLPFCQFWVEKVAGPAHGFCKAARPPTERLGSWLPTMPALTPAMTEFHGQLSMRNPSRAWP